MAKGAPNHFDFHLDKTWEYVTGSGSDLTQWGYSTMNSGLPHDLFHIFYYPGVYIGVPLVSMLVIGFIISVFDFRAEELKKDKEFLDSLLKKDDEP